jgi:DNA polymerase-3 subunit delta
MTPDDAIAQAERGELGPIYLVLGEETHLAGDVLRALRRAALAGPAAGFNDDRFAASDTSAETVLGAARTAPMMAQRRLVTVSGLDKWDGRESAEALDALAAYAAEPVPTTTLVLVAQKLHGSRKIVKAAKQGNWVVACEPLARRDLGPYVERGARRKGHTLAPGVAEALAELCGPQLGPVADALERLSLYVGPGAVIGDDALVAVVTRVRQETVWNLLDALASRDLGKTLGALQDTAEGREAPLPLLGSIAWRVRQLAKFQAGLTRGMSRDAAASASGVPPFKARDIERTVRQLGPAVLERWLLLLAEADLALKGSRRPPGAVLATMLVNMCAAS